jgi:O-antigen/teichoic acid export membrane protein
MPQTIVPTSDKGFKQTVFGAACLSIQPLLLNALSIPAMALIIRRLGPDNYGRWATATSLISAVGFLTSLGLRGKFIRSVAQNPASAPQALAEQLGTRLVLTFIAMAAVILACLVLHYSPIVVQCTIIASVGMLLTTGWSTLADLMQALERFRTIASVNLVSGLLLTIASVVVILAGGGPVALSLAYVLGPLTTFALLLAILRRQRFSVYLTFHLQHAWRLIWTSRHFTAQQLLAAAEANAAALMLPKLIGSASFGLFSAGALLGDRLSVIPDAIGTAVYPMLSKQSRQDRRLAARLACACVVLAMLACACLAAVGAVFASTIAHILLPNVAEDCQRVIAITIWALPLAGAYLVMSYSLLAAGREASQTRALALSVVINLTLGIILITRAGMIGACWFVTLRSAIRMCVLIPEFARVFITPYWFNANRTLLGNVVN